MKTYRDILKWGDKREEPLGEEIKEIIKQKFNLSEEELASNSLKGNNQVVLSKKCQISEDTIQQFIEISGKKNVVKDIEDRVFHSYGKHFV